MKLADAATGISREKTKKRRSGSLNERVRTRALAEGNAEGYQKGRNEGYSDGYKQGRIAGIKYLRRMVEDMIDKQGIERPTWWISALVKGLGDENY